METIRWDKQYYEERGSKDEDGYYDFFYRYFIFQFILPDGERIKVRQYLDTKDKCSLFVPYDELAQKKDEASMKKMKYIAAVINFLRHAEHIAHFDYFNKTYQPIDLGKIHNNLKDFHFIRESIPNP